MRDFKNVFGAFITGVAAGTVLGMLFNPTYSGSANKKAEEEFEELTNKFKQELDEKYEDTMAQLEEVNRSTSKYVDEKVKDAVKDMNN